MDRLATELSAKRVSDIDSLTGHHAEQVRGLEEELATRAVALSEREGEVRHLKAILEDSREGLGSASQQISNLEAQLSAAKKEAAQSRAQLGRRETECEALKVGTTHTAMQSVLNMCVWCVCVFDAGQYKADSVHCTCMWHHLQSDLVRLESEQKQLRESSAEQLRNQKMSLTASLEGLWSTRVR